MAALTLAAIPDQQTLAIELLENHVRGHPDERYPTGVLAALLEHRDPDRFRTYFEILVRLSKGTEQAQAFLEGARRSLAPGAS